MSGSRLYDKMLEKATSPLLLDVDWESILRMCDLVRQEDVQTKYALNQLKKKLNSDNIHVLSYSLNCLESLVKNCGSKVHQEVATKEFMDIMRNMAGTKTDPVKSKVLELIQCWSHAFKKNPNYRIVEDYFNAMKLEGFSFQPLKESEAMFDVEEAPAWKEDSECTSCFRCRTEFSTLRRRHHCRACGQIFCHACSSKTSPIPKFGIEKEVRVCDVCYDKLRGNTLSQSASSSSSGIAGNEEQLPIEYIMSPLYKEATSATNNPKKPAEKTEQEFQDELNLALALSQSEAEAKENSKRSSSFKKTNSTSSKKKEKSSSSSSSKNWQDQPSNASAPYADSPPLASQSQNNSKGLSRNSFILENSNTNVHDSDDKGQSTYNDEEIRINIEIDEFVEELKKLLELYLNRMKSDSMRGRSITNDTAVQSLFLQLQHLHPKLLSYIKYQEDARGYYENLQDKLTQLKDAREALNALRHENFEKKKRELEEKERLRQLQISHKLQLMRQQKQSYYLYQNQLNLQRLQEQERDLQLRLSQQRELVSKRDQSLFSNGLSFKPSNGLNDSYGNSNSIPDMSAMMMNPNQMQYGMQHNLQQPNLANNLNNYQQQAFLANQYGVSGVVGGVGMSMNPSLQATGIPVVPDQMNNGLPMLDSKLQSLQLQQMQQSVMMQQQLPAQVQPSQQPIMVGAYQQWQQNIQPSTPQQQQQSQTSIQQQPQQNIQYQQYPQHQQPQIPHQISSNVVVQGNEEPPNIPREAPLISFD